MSLPPYKRLLTYRYAEIIHDLTVAFVLNFIGEIEHRRTREQMVQAARSGKQNIIEGTSRTTSKKSEITLLDVAAASIEELIGDYEDFLRQRNLPIWPKDSFAIQEFRKIGFRFCRGR